MKRVGRGRAILGLERTSEEIRETRGWGVGIKKGSKESRKERRDIGLVIQ